MASSERFKVLHIAQKLPGGVGAYLAEVAASQIGTLGPDRLRILIAEPERASLPLLPDRCLQYFPSSDRSLPALLRFAMAARRAILRERPDIVHLHSSYAGLLRPLIAALPRTRRPRVIYCAHGWAFNIRWAPARRNMFAMIERWLARFTDRILCISQFEFDSAIMRGLPREKLAVLHNGVSSAVEPGTFEPVAMPRNKINLLFIGRQDEQKGFDVAENAMAMLADTAVHLHAIGAAVVARDGATARGLPNVTHYGWQQREDIWRFVEGADAVIVPSRWEGFGLAAIEGMRQGKPVIASRVDALPEVVTEGKTGLLVPPEDVAALADCIRGLSRAQLREMGRAARTDFLDRFTGERMNDEIIDTYRSVLGQAKAVRQ